MDQRFGRSWATQNGSGHDSRYVVPWGKWLAWDGARWKTDASGEAQRRAKLAARRRTLEALDERDAKSIGFAIRSESARGIEAALSLACNVSNGSIDLKTGMLHRHRRG